MEIPTVPQSSAATKVKDRSTTMGDKSWRSFIAVDALTVLGRCSEDAVKKVPEARGLRYGLSVMSAASRTHIYILRLRLTTTRSCNK